MCSDSTVLRTIYTSEVVKDSFKFMASLTRAEAAVKMMCLASREIPFFLRLMYCREHSGLL